MPVRQIGTLDVSLIGLGCNNFGGRIDERQSIAVVEAALDAGINLFDTADVYGATKSEEFLGRALGKDRADVLIATKFGARLDETHNGAAPSYVKSALEDSLRRLGTDYVDLYQLHQPDPGTPISETLGALADLVAEGKVREIGCSNFSAAQLAEAEAAVSAGAPRFVSIQNEYSLFERGPSAMSCPNVIGWAPLSSLISPSKAASCRASTGSVNRPPPVPGWPACPRRARAPCCRLPTSSWLALWSASPRRAATPWLSWPSPGSPPTVPSLR